MVVSQCLQQLFCQMYSRFYDTAQMASILTIYFKAQ